MFTRIEHLKWLLAFSSLIALWNIPGYFNLNILACIMQDFGLLLFSLKWTINPPFLIWFRNARSGHLKQEASHSIKICGCILLKAEEASVKKKKSHVIWVSQRAYIHFPEWRVLYPPRLYVEANCKGSNLPSVASFS